MRDSPFNVIMKKIIRERYLELLEVFLWFFLPLLYFVITDRTTFVNYNFLEDLDKTFKHLFTSIFICFFVIIFRLIFLRYPFQFLREKFLGIRSVIIEDDVNDCNALKRSVEEREDIEIVGITDSDVEALQLVKVKHPEGIILDIELNGSSSGSTDSLDFLDKLKELNLKYSPIIIVTTHINSKRTYEVLHRKGVDIILYKDHPKYSPNHVLNNFIALSLFL